MLFRKKRNKHKNPEVLAQMDGREIKYVTRRVRDDDGNVKELILGKDGRIVVIDEEIRIMCGTEDVFRCLIDDCEYSMLMSGDGITVSGINTVSGERDDMVVFYKYHRK